jgi:hypothetical protein
MTSSNIGHRAGIDNGYCRLIVHRTVTFIVSFQPCYAPDVRVVAMGQHNIMRGTGRAGAGFHHASASVFYTPGTRFVIFVV